VVVKRIKPNILSDRLDESRALYNDVVIGLPGGEGLDWILSVYDRARAAGAEIDLPAHR